MIAFMRAFARRLRMRINSVSTYSEKFSISAVASTLRRERFSLNSRGASTSDGSVSDSLPPNAEWAALVAASKPSISWRVKSWCAYWTLRGVQRLWTSVTRALSLLASSPTKPAKSGSIPVRHLSSFSKNAFGSGKRPQGLPECFSIRMVASIVRRNRRISWLLLSAGSVCPSLTDRNA